MKKIVALLMVVLLCTLSSCGEKVDPMEHLTTCDVLILNEPDTVELDKWYVCNATVEAITVNGCEISVYYPKYDFKVNFAVSFYGENSPQISVHDKIVLLGLLKRQDKSRTFVNSKILDTETVKENFIVGKIRERVGTITDTRYYNHEYDKNVGQIVAFEAKGDDDGIYALEYNENGNLVESIRESEQGTATTIYTYNEDDSLLSVEELYDYDDVRNGNKFVHTYDKDSDGKITKETVVNVAKSQAHASVYTYDEYEGSRVVKKTEYGQNKNYDITIHYDEYGNVVKESSSISKFFEYAVVASKHK